MDGNKKTPSNLGDLSLIIGVLAMIIALSFFRQFPAIMSSLLLAVPGIFVAIACAFSKKSNRLQVAAGIALNLGAILFTFMGLPTYGSSRSRARRISCTSNLKQIGLSLKQYAMDYNDCFPHLDGPDGLEALRANDYLTDYGVYTCPQTTTSGGSGTEKLTIKNTDYIYFGGFMEGHDPKVKGFTDTPLVIDNPAKDKKYLNVLFQDGHVQSFTTTAKNCKEAIDFLHKKHKYTPTHYRILRTKAIKADIRRGLP